MIDPSTRQLCFAAALVSVALAPAAAAAQTSATMTVSAEVLPSCSVQAGTLAFGALEAGDNRGGSTAQAALTLDCTPGTAFAVTMDQGLHGGRRMADAGGATFLDYEIYQDAAATRPWGGSTDGAVGGMAPGEGKVALNAYGRVFAQAGARPGRYEDVVTVLVSF